MYGKLFASMYEGTLYGQWQAIITLQQMVILADEDGALDMTPPALAAKTSVPLEIIEKGLEQLSQPDRYSRSEKEDGRRIVLIDEDRPWGWFIVNYKHYRNLASREEKKRKDRERIAEKRNKNNSVATCRNESLPVDDSSDESADVANVAHTDTDTDTKEKPYGSSAKPKNRIDYPEEFETLWAKYPKRDGSNPKKGAFSAYRQRRREGVSHEVMAVGLERYAKWCEGTGKVGSETVMQAKRFFGPGEEWANDWEATVKPVRLPKDFQQAWDILDACGLPVGSDSREAQERMLNDHLASHPEDRQKVEAML